MATDTFFANTTTSNFKEDLGDAFDNEDQQSAFTIIENVMKMYGLESLTGFIRDYIINNDVVNENVLVGEIRRQPEYIQRFQANQQRIDAGLNALSEGQFIALENTYRQYLRQSGLPPTFYDNYEDFQTMIANDVSPAELAERVNQGYEAIQFANPEVVNQMKELYGVGEGELAAYFLDPERATPLLLKQARAAEAAAGAAQAGGALTVQEAEMLADEGITMQQARSGIGLMQDAEELFTPLTGEAGEAFTREEQLGAVFQTDPRAAQRLRQRTRRRQTQFESGGRFAGQGAELTGLQ
jgi:hypothetical protein